MSDIMTRLGNYPEVSFINHMSYQELRDKMVDDYEKKLKEITGEEKKLAMGDPYRLILYSCAVAIYQGYQFEDRAAKRGPLKYSKGDYLDNLAAFKGVLRNEASPAKTNIRFTLSVALTKEAVIPVGTRVKGTDLYFETTEKGKIKPGETSVDIQAVCQKAGIEGNGYMPGSIKTLVDLLPYTLKVENISESSGGTERETDDELAERIYLAPSSYSTAGTEGAYEYWVKTYEERPMKFRITSELPGEVDIYTMSPDGEMPDDDYIKRLEEYLKCRTIKPLTDNVVVKRPEIISYDITFSYHINEENRDIEETINGNVRTACENYITAQREIGKDIDPSELIGMLYEAGAVKILLTSPNYTEITNSQVAIMGNLQMDYRGIKERSAKGGQT